LPLLKPLRNLALNLESQFRHIPIAPVFPRGWEGRVKGYGEKRIEN
jgi:hypothetical protein